MINKILLSVLFLAAGFYAHTQSPINLDVKKLPEINSLSSSNTVYRQLCSAVEFNDRQAAAGKKQVYEFYTYTAGADDTLFSIHAATNMPYDTIATLNSISNISEPIAGRKLILPSVKGIFICSKPESSIEILTLKENNEILEDSENICYTIGNEFFYFLPGKRFSSTERAFFLDASMRMPLDYSWISSAYGMRKSPISGSWKFHRGIDFAAPEGTPVYACTGGKAAVCVNGDKTFGNYVIISHSGGMTSVYAHLSKIEIKKGAVVYGGEKIGLVGKTGAATGPHLHFEIRMNGVSTDPAGLLPEK